MEQDGLDGLAQEARPNTSEAATPEAAHPPDGEGAELWVDRVIAVHQLRRNDPQGYQEYLARCEEATPGSKKQIEDLMKLVGYSIASSRRLFDRMLRSV